MLAAAARRVLLAWCCQSRFDLLREVAQVVAIGKDLACQHRGDACDPGGVKARVKVLFRADPRQHQRILALRAQAGPIRQRDAVPDDINPLEGIRGACSFLRLRDAGEVIIRWQAPDSFGVPAWRQVQRDEDGDVRRKAIAVEVQPVHVHQGDVVFSQGAVEVRLLRGFGLGPHRVVNLTSGNGRGVEPAHGCRAFPCHND